MALISNDRQFEAYAADILDLCYADNDKRTLTLLDEKSMLYSDQQPSILIDDLCSKTLVSTTCMQAYVNRIWYGNQFHKEKNSTWELLVIERIEVKTSDLVLPSRSLSYVFALHYCSFLLCAIEFSKGIPWVFSSHFVDSFNKMP